jgi:tetratricopeptide (TPR) repeat protein
MATIPEALASAIKLHQAGRMQPAEHIYRQILAVEPNHADAMHLLGVMAAQLGKFEVAVEYIERAIGVNGAAAVFHNNLGEAYRAMGKPAAAIVACRKALELNPQYAEAVGNLGHALKDQGELDQAIECFRHSLELKPDYCEVHNNLGIVLKEQGKLDEAIACYRRAVEIKPDFFAAHNNMGVAFKEQGNLDEAIPCYRRALELKPDYAVAHCNLGIALFDKGKLDEAIACYRRALELNADYAEAYNNLGMACKEKGKLDEAAACFRRALELKPDSPAMHSNLGVACKEQWKLDEAMACWRRALELSPDFAEVHVNMGSTLAELGDLDAAEESFRAAVRGNPRFAPAHYKLAELLGGRLPDADLETQQRMLKDTTLSDAQRLGLHFSLAQVFDARGDYLPAAEHARKANALQLSEWRKGGQEYDWQGHERLAREVIAVCDARFFERTSGLGLESELPVFIVGLPRSGTTLVAQILASHSQVHSAGEIKLVHETVIELCGQRPDSFDGLFRLNRETVLRAAERHVERLQGLDRDVLRIVDKMPENYMYLGLLAMLFPRAKFIHCRRDLRDVAVSCWFTHFQEVRWASDPRHIASRFRVYRRMMDHWRQVLPAPVLDVDYEETVADLETAARRIVAWCGLDWEAGCLEFHRTKRPVRTASSVQVRRPIFKTSVGRWKNYEEALAPLFAELGGT